MSNPLRKPLLLRVAPAVFLALAAYTAAFLALVLGAVTGVAVGVAVGVAGPTTAAELSMGVMATVLVQQVAVYVTLAWGFWRERRWSRPALVWEGPAFLLLLLALAPASARVDVLMHLPQTAVLSLAFYWYLYRKANVRVYWQRNAVRSAAQPGHA